MPNWVDFVVLIVLFRAGYVGLEYGGFTALLQAAGAVSATILTIHLAPVLWVFVEPWAMLKGSAGAFLNFWLFFTLCIFLIRMLIQRFAGMKWEKLSWFGQSLGLLLGVLRGAWWVAFLILAFTDSGVPYVQQSTQERSLIASRFIEPSRFLISGVSSRFPAAPAAEAGLVPSLTGQRDKKAGKRS